MTSFSLPKLSILSLIKYGWSVCLMCIALLFLIAFRAKQFEPIHVLEPSIPPRSPRSTILTLFTTFKPNPKRLAIYQTTIRNWATLGSAVRPVLYANLLESNNTLVDYAIKHGWSIAQIPKENKYKTPYVNHMYMDAEERFESEFYSYANGDIIFEQGIVRTLKAVSDQMPQKRVLVIGRRVNYELKNHSHVDYSSISEFRLHRTLVAHKVRWGMLQAIDFFITRRGLFSWDEMAHVVVGRAGYDAYVLYYATYRDHATLISASNTMTAYHLQATNWQLSHRKDNDKDSRFNMNAIRQREKGHTGKVWNAGSVRAARMQTVRQSQGNETIINIVPLGKKKSKKN